LKAQEYLTFSLGFLGLWRLTPLSTIFQVILWQFYWWRKQEYPEKTTCRKSFANFITYIVVLSTPQDEKQSPQKPTNIWFVNQVSDADSWEPLVIWPGLVIFYPETWQGLIWPCFQYKAHNIPNTL
jgi:hypothetical protein